MSFVTNPGGNGAFPASITPMPSQVVVQDNYIDFNTVAGGQWAQQYLPELYEQEVERYGNRTLSGFLRMVGAEMPMTSDQVIWTEQNRLHVAYDTVAVAAGGKVFPKFRVTITKGANNPDTSGIRVGNTILISDNATGLVTLKALVLSNTDNATTDGYTLECHAYEGAALTNTTGTNSLFVYGSEFPKGSDGMKQAIEPNVTTFANSPIILKDNYELSGSDTAQIGWIEVATEDGTSGYLWYLKAESETRLRFEDYLEMSMVEGELNANAGTFGTGFGPTGANGSNIKGTEGLFAAIESRGNVYSGFAGAAAPGSGALGDFDEILKQLDKQGAIEENMLFLSRATALDFDDMIGAQAGGGFPSTQSASYGLFDNEAEMAMNFGFSGFRRGSYDFYKTDWKYLNDATTRGMSNAIDGVMIPAGTSTVYDQMLGSNIRRPFLHVRFRASETEDRRFKAWITGSVGGAYTSDLDTMRVNFLSERCLVTQAANNFVLFKGA